MPALFPASFPGIPSVGHDCGASKGNTARTHHSELNGSMHQTVLAHSDAYLTILMQRLSAGSYVTRADCKELLILVHCQGGLQFRSRPLTSGRADVADVLHTINRVHYGIGMVCGLSNSSSGCCCRTKVYMCAASHFVGKQ